MNFRIYCATGGLIGRLVNLLVEVISNAIYSDKTIITLAALAKANQIASYDIPLGIKSPFSKKFDLLPSKEVISRVMSIGATEYQQELAIKKQYRPSRSHQVL